MEQPDRTPIVIPDPVALEAKIWQVDACYRKLSPFFSQYRREHPETDGRVTDLSQASSMERLQDSVGNALNVMLRMIERPSRGAVQRLSDHYRPYSLNSIEEAEKDFAAFPEACAILQDVRGQLVTLYDEIATYKTATLGAATEREAGKEKPDRSLG